MIELSDEILCRYLDKELDAVATNDVEKALALDAGARVRLQRMRDADAVLRKAIPQYTVNDDPLVQFIKTGTLAEKAVTAVGSNQRPLHRRAMLWGSMAAGFLGLMVGALAMRQLSGSVALDQSLAGITQETGKSLSVALDTINSGTTFQHDKDKVQMVLSFNAKDGRHCRVFEVANTQGNAEGVACRDSVQWKIVAWDASQSKSDGYRTAGGGELVDVVMNRLGGDAALESPDEQKLINNQWR